MALPEDHLAKFHKMTDAKEMWDAIKSRFGGNDKSKKIQKFQSLLSQLEIHGAGVSTKDANQKFLRSLPSAWSQVSLIMRTKPGVDSVSFNDLYNNLRVFENDVKGSTASSSSTQNVAFVSENTSSTNDVSTAYSVSNPSGQNSQCEQTSSYSLLANQSSCPQLDHEDLEQLDEYDLEEMDLKWQVAMISMRMKKFYKKTGRKLQFDAKEPVGFDKTKVECYNCHKTGHFARECRTKGNQDSRRRDAWNSGNKDGRRSGKQEDSKALVTIDGEGVDWTSHSEEEEDYALMACNSSGSDTEVTSCSNECKESYAKLKKLYDAQREQLSDASIEIKAYTQGLKKVEAQLVAHQQGQLWYEQKIKFMKIDLDDKTDVLTYHKKLLAEAMKEKEDLKAKVEKWHNSSKNLGKLINTQMSANDKFGLGYGDHRYDGILSYENEVLQSVFKGKESDFENPPLYDRFVTAGGMNDVPPPMTGNYMPSGPDIEIDYSQFTYGPKQTQSSESETQNSKFDTCESNISTEAPKLVSEPVVNESNVSCQPKVKQIHMTTLVLLVRKESNIRPPVRPNQSENQANKHAGLQEANQNAGTEDIIDAGDSKKEDAMLRLLFNTASTPVSTASTDNDLPNPDQDDSEIPALEDIYKTPTHILFPTSRINSFHPSTLILGDPKSAVLNMNNCLFGLFLGSQNGPKKISEHLEMKVGLDAMQEEFAAVQMSVARLVAQGHRQEEGIDYDEVFAPMARIESIRIFLAFASYMGFLCFIDPKYPQKVYKVVKALYGLHQAPRAWYATLSTFLLQHGYRRGTIDKTLFIKKDKHDIILVQVYVDDIIFGSTKKTWCDDFDGIIEEILKKFDFVNVKTASTPIETQKPLVKDEEASDVDVHLYRSMIGSLMYLTASRPDIMFAVCACSRFQVTPKTSHLSVVKRIFRYLKGKPKLGLWYPRVSSFDLEAYSDSDYAGANLDRKSTTGGCQFLGRRLISWQCKKQTIVATSTTEAEYVAAASCCGQVLWIQNQMLDYGFNFMNTKHHFIRDAYEKKLIQVLKIHTNDNVADLLTKAFDVSSSLGFRESLGRALDGTEALMLPKLFILWLATVSTDSAELVPMGKVSTAIETLKKNTAKALISLSSTITHSTIMVVLESCPKHNMVAYLEKTDGNAEFYEIIDFLTRISIYHALAVSPVVSTTFVAQFWTSAKSKIINNVRHNTAKVAGKPVSISEASIRSDLLFDDADGIDSLPNQAIFDAIQLMGYEGDLTVLTFNKALFSPQWRHLDAKKKFVMYPRFISIFLDKQLENVPVPLDHFPVNALTSKVFSFMVKKGKHFSGKVTPLLAYYVGYKPAEDDGLTFSRPYESLNLHPLLLHPKFQFKPRKFKLEGKWMKRKENDEDVLCTEDCLSTAQQKVSTDKEKVSIDRPIVSTDGSKVSTDKEKYSTDRTDEGSDDQTEGGRATQTTQIPTSTIFRDDETIAQVLLNMSQAKAVSREKEKGVEFKDIEETERSRPTSTRSLLTLKPLPKIDPKDKGKKKIEEEDESESESGRMRKVRGKKRLAEEEASNEALIRQLCGHKGTFWADRLLDIKASRDKKEEHSHMRKLLDSDLKNQMFEEIQALYEKIKRSAEDFISIGSAEDERLIKKMNEKGIDSLKNESVKEEGKEEKGSSLYELQDLWLRWGLDRADKNLVELSLNGFAGDIAKAHAKTSMIVGEGAREGFCFWVIKKQKIAIARAVFKDLTILLLDEATSALDVESECVFQEALERLMRGRTTVLVAHRLSTIQGVDNIGVVQDGRIVEQGSHSELLSQGSDEAYFRMLQLQQHRV
ncbi:ribonuclease H-like domain-containing protein [Tanacetum coccineum]